MPIVSVDGKKIQFPDGMSNEDIKAVLQKQFAPQQEATAGEEIIRPIARAARSGLSGLASVADIAGAAVEPIRQGMRSGLEAVGVDFMGANTPYIPPTQGAKNIFDKLTGGIAKPRDDAERIVDVAGETVAGGGAMKGIQKGSELLVKGGSEVLKKLAPQTTTELASLAGAGAGSEIASQIDPSNPIAPVIGAVVGGAATLKGIKTIRESGDMKLLDKAYFNRQAQREPELNKGYFDKQATKIIAKNLEASPEKLASLKSELQKDKNLVLPDIGGDELRALTRQVGKHRGGARNDIDKFFVGRDRDAGQRIINAINSKVSGTDKYFGSMDELTTVRSELAKDQYGLAYDKHQQMKITPSLDKFIQDGRFQSALADARKAGLINVNEPVGSLRTLDQVYRRLRDNASEAIQNGQGNTGDSLNQLARDFVKRLDIEAPEYKKARNTFAGFSDLMEAQKLGSEYLGKRPEQISRVLKNMTAGERDAYKVGVRESLEKRVLLSGASTDEAAKIFAKPEHRTQLKVILGDDFADFSRQMRKETRMADSKFRVIGGSRTDYNTIEDGSFIESAANLVKGGKTAIAHEAINTLADSIKRKYLGINDANSKILAKALTSNKGSIKAIDDLIAKANSPTKKIELQNFKDDYGHLLVPALQEDNQE